jgi:uncharacterized repeat protein (TIGR03803 family)
MKRYRFAALVAVTMAALISQPATGQSTGEPPAPTFTVLHSFTGPPDGGFPFANVILDQAGNLYGATLEGGSSSGDCADSGGCGTIFKIDPSGNESILYAFRGSDRDGQFPYGGLLRDSAGNFYGTTWGGGTSGVAACENTGCGTVFALTAAGKERVLYNFTGGTDGANPHAALTLGTDGVLYSTTYMGGAYNAGTVFSVDSEGVESVIHSFDFDGAVPDGSDVWGGLIRDSTGNLYGMTFGGYNLSCVPSFQIGCGIIYEMTEAGTETILYPFAGLNDGNWPGGALIRDSEGNLYGTSQGGSSQWGTVFKLDPAGKLTVLHTFTGGAGGGDPWAGVVRDAAGNLYGTTLGGGGTACSPNGCGTVFILEPSGKFSILHSFTGGADGWSPNSALILDPSGNLYGVATNGGLGDGVVFKITR